MTARAVRVRARVGEVAGAAGTRCHVDPTPPPFARSATGPATRTVARHAGRHGEVVLRECAGDYEIIGNGVFLADTRDGRSERCLVRSALDAARPAHGRTVLLAGLGVGFSLAEALASPDVARVVVVEWEPSVVAWNRTATGARSGGRVDDPRVACEIADLVEWLQRRPVETFDAVCLDVDNGPHWTVRPDNRWLYEDEGLAATRARLADGGVLSVWSAAHVPAFARRLRRRFRDVRRLAVPVARGEPDVIYLARR